MYTLLLQRLEIFKNEVFIRILWNRIQKSKLGRRQVSIRKKSNSWRRNVSFIEWEIDLGLAISEVSNHVW